MIYSLEKIDEQKILKVIRELSNGVTKHEWNDYVEYLLSTIEDMTPYIEEENPYLYDFDERGLFTKQQIKNYMKGGF